MNTPTVLALTGTATPQIQQDIISRLDRPDMSLHIHSMERTNIILVVDRHAKSEEEKRERLLDYLDKLAVPAIIYFSSRNKAEEMTMFLMEKLNTARLAFYHAGMDASDRLKVQEQFIHDQLDIICSTSAFGMGINKSDIRTVIHYHLPVQLESFMQEIGRAGRDGKESTSLLLYKEGDNKLPLSIIQNELPDTNEMKHVFQQLFELDKKKLSLPVTKAEIEGLFGLTEIKWRLLHYQLERHGIVKNDTIIYDQIAWKQAFIEIDRFCRQRLQYKRSQFHKMMEWVLAEDCFRKQLYHSFQDEITHAVQNCCSNCGYDIDFQRHEKIKADQSFEWQDVLKAKLLIKE